MSRCCAIRLNVGLELTYANLYALTFADRTQFTPIKKAAMAVKLKKAVIGVNIKITLIIIMVS